MTLSANLRWQGLLSSQEVEPSIFLDTSPKEQQRRAQCRCWVPGCVDGWSIDQKADILGFVTLWVLVCGFVNVRNFAGDGVCVIWLAKHHTYRNEPTSGFIRAP
jgi:hypothetical protein